MSTLAYSHCAGETPLCGPRCKGWMHYVAQRPRCEDGFRRGEIGNLERFSNHYSIASQHHDRSQSCAPTLAHPRRGCDSRGRFCHTLLHFDTLFDTFVNRSPHCMSHTVGWGDLVHTFPHDRSLCIICYTSQSTVQYGSALYTNLL